MKVTAFILCSSFGALGGIILASSQSSASLDLGSGNVLLFSVAAAVIGGTSLFGGRGKPRDAILGALVIAIIPNGLLSGRASAPSGNRSSPASCCCSRPRSTRSRGGARRAASRDRDRLGTP